ncbi:MAG: diguanylate cyclase [Deltaproteobacteria bacterium]|nr:diguanylate cyclase [Deltaproteobacteria bacterium]TLN02933.1 MAG: diguanylate cyclase [bacterium]
MILSILLTASSAGMFLLALFGWKRHKTVPAARFFSAYMLAVAIYCGAFAVRMSSAPPLSDLIAPRIECFGIALLSALWLLLALYCSGVTTRVSRLLYLLPVLTFTVIAGGSLLPVSDQKQLLSVTSVCSKASFAFTQGHLSWISTASVLFAFLAGNFLFLFMLFSSPRHRRLQAAGMFLGSLLPWGVLYLELGGLLSLDFNPFPFAFAAAGLFYTFGLFRYRFVNLAPLLRNTLVENLKDGALVFNQAGRVLDLNRAMSSLLDISQQDAIGELRDQVFASYPKLLEAVIAGGGFVDDRGPAPVSSRLTAQVTVTPIRGRWRKFAGSLVLIQDISGLKKAESDLRDSEEKFRLLFEAAPDPILLMDDSGRCIDCNSAAVQLFGVASRGNVLHRSLAYFSPEYQPDGELSSEKETGVRQLALAEGTALSEWAFRHQDGSLIIVDLSIAIISIKGIRVQLIHLRDITEKKYVEQKLREISLTDELTGLHNRRGFMTLALQQIKIADRLAQGMTLLYADLDDLKGINDTYGHLAGDQALIDAAAILKTSLRASDILARLGGDEFVGLILESGGETELAVLARVQENLNAHNLLRIRPFRLSFSIGTARYEVTSPCSVEELLEAADREMYRNKLEKKSLQGK